MRNCLILIGNGLLLFLHWLYFSLAFNIIFFGKPYIFTGPSSKERIVIVKAIELGKDVKLPEETEVTHILGAKHTGIQI
jgi:uncharacterized SAM-binding protein YcdF (DUF218 family)